MVISELAQLLPTDPTLRILDVRTPGEFETAHVKGSYNVPLDQLGEHAKEIRAAKASAVVLVCQSGQRARRAEALLQEAGMGNLHVLDGGMRAWLDGGHPVVHGRKRMSLERQVRIAAGSMVALGSIAALAVGPLWAIVPALVGSGLVFAGLSDTCAMGMLLAKLPYNAPATCDTEAMVRRFLATEAMESK